MRTSPLKEAVWFVCIPGISISDPSGNNVCPRFDRRMNSLLVVRINCNSEFVFYSPMGAGMRRAFLPSWGCRFTHNGWRKTAGTPLIILCASKRSRLGAPDFICGKDGGVGD